jgi:hypothetical protein
LDICSGTLLSDVSDHFFTFVLTHSKPTPKQLHLTVLTRDFSDNKLLGFREELAQLHGILYFTSKLESNVGNPKKTWETLNEILGKRRNSEKIDKINVNGIPTSDPLEIANQFNTFSQLRGSRSLTMFGLYLNQQKTTLTITALSQICCSRTQPLSM